MEATTCAGNSIEHVRAEAGKPFLTSRRELE